MAGVRTRRSLKPRVYAALRFHDVGDADLHLAAAHHRDKDAFTGGRLHQHVEAGLLLHPPWRWRMRWCG